MSEGARSTRAGRTAYGGKRSANPALTSQVLIALNAAVFLLIAATGGGTSIWFFRLALIPSGATTFIGGQPEFVSGVADGAYWQLVTSAFTHVQIWHIGFNMVALWFLGPQLEAVLGRARFLAIYLLSALSGSVLVYWLSGVHTPTLGASGAVYGLLGALAVVALKVHGNLAGLLPWLVINFLITFTVPNISWQGHLGGFLMGVGLTALFVYAPKPHRSRWQVAGAVAVSVLLVLAILARSAILA